ncbi:SpoIIE family protein phosphatase [Oculatella sp. LEGE 06141]|uniref:SpoIIE family protein phosphatase n=1 Tax=Oculatella sp. LEGE 06141 TaxID=1828648 RepID=UPI00187E66DD|nr:SpoIIE family protein phosphatase [Oculatella sp. LEGE 06141]MBE9179822.1 SpoIIE family protein phosphatase [Oculatella sp. LEGE 06141]
MNEADLGKLRLMVVDDESDNLDLLYRTFRRQFEVFLADSAFKALQVLEQEGEMGIIISDQRMPKMNGTEFLSLTAEQFPDTIRILLTGYTDVEDLVSAINAGKVFKYITKPWKPDELKTTIQQAAETYRVLKKRTNELHRALRRESLFNTVTTAIRGSLDYHSMLQSVVETVGQTFAADCCVLHPIEATGTTAHPCHLVPEMYSFVQPGTIAAQQPTITQIDETILLSAVEQHQIQLIPAAETQQGHTILIVPLSYQQEGLAVLVLYKQGPNHPWMAEELQLIAGVAEQAALAISQAKLYQRIQEQTEQMRAELSVARQIQSNLLRQSWSEPEGVNIQACCYPAREVGGDFFEVYIHPQGDVWAAVGDVSGKGVPAALFMASAISLLRRELSQEISPEPNSVLKNLNSSLSEDLVSSNCFITMALARYSPSTQELAYANAGHVYPLVWSPTLVNASGAESATAGSVAPCCPEPNYLKVRGVPLGILPDWRSPAGTTTLKPGQVLLLISDGITEATVMEEAADGTSSPSMLRETGLWQLLLQQSGTLNLNQLLTMIQARNPVQDDDQTILSLEVL